VQPILHLSLAVRELAAAREFYVDVLGCRPGRVRDAWIDVWFHGAQVTLHHAPAHAPGRPEPVRHFGVTLAPDELRTVVARLEGAGVPWVDELRIDDRGTAREQTKCKVADPSGNVIEFKSYADPAVALELP
jgi:extradiol dioxygenase family protein